MHAVRRFDVQAELVLQALPQQIGHTQRIEVVAQAAVAVVKTNHPVARIHQRAHHARRPGNQLHAQTHDEQHHRQMRRIWRGINHLNINIVSSYFHSLLLPYYCA